MEEELLKYQNQLVEIKRRISIIREFLNNEKTTGFFNTDVEFVCLQLRKIIELIAFSSLIANKEEYSKAREKYKNDWKPEYIFKDLGRLNPDFYPVPVNGVRDGKYLRLIPKKDGFLSKDDAIELYKKCNSVLHVNNPYKGEKDLKKINKNFRIWTNKIVTLLDNHNITLYGKDLMVAGEMQSTIDGNPKAMIYKAINKAPNNL